MDAQPDVNAFEAFVEMTKAAIPEVVDRLHGNRALADEKFLRWSAQQALEAYPRDQLPQLFVAVANEASEDVKAELATLLLSFYMISDKDWERYLDEHSSCLDGIRYRFERFLYEPDWATSVGPHDYATAIVRGVIVQRLLTVGDWELPERTARRVHEPLLVASLGLPDRSYTKGRERVIARGPFAIRQNRMR